MKKRSFSQYLLRSAALGVVMVSLGGPLYAQQTAPPPATSQTPPDQIPPKPEDTAKKGDVVVITGTRLQNQFTSSSPMQVISADEAAPKGLSDLGSLLRDSTVAAGSPQITSITSSAFVQNGGTGNESISLRGLGANRTLVLLDGRRAGPAGTRGSVGAFDLNVIPLSAIERVDILKDGASSVYGSDAVAGVVNIITKKGDESNLDLFYSAPQHGGGEQTRINGSFGHSADNYSFRITADYFKEGLLTRGQRDFFDCGQPYVFNGNGSRADLIDPRSNRPVCSSDLPWGQIWYYDYASPGAISRPWRVAPGFFQYDYSGKLAGLLPKTGPNGSNFVAPAGWFPVGYGELARPGAANDPYWTRYAATSDAVLDYHHPYVDNTALQPGVERMTLFGNGEYSINDHVSLYADFLLNRRTTKVPGYRQVWTYQYIYDYGGGDYVGDPLGIRDGFGANFSGYSPTGITDHANDTTQVDYTRFVAGARGDLDFMGGPGSGWTWDAALQFSRSDGTYKTDIVWDDAITPYEFRTNLCAGTTTVDRGAPCVDIDWFSPAVMNGQFTAAEKAFLFGTVKGKTVYEQTSFEAYASGPVFKLPAGTVEAVIGFDYEDDRINDTPSEATQKGWAWGSSKSGITRGDDDTRAVFAEVSVPLLKDLPGVKDLSFTASGRYTDVASYGGGSTYKIGLSWAPTDYLRFRASQGTSFRSPALFELYLASETSFPNQRTIDPCIQWAANLANQSITQRVADNCAADGISPTHTGSGSSATAFSSGGKGKLTAETSLAKSLGVVFSPTFLPDYLGKFEFSVDYFDIAVDNEVTRLGATNIVNGCYLSDHHATDPLCSLFTRQTTTGANFQNILVVTDNYLNISTQQNRGIDFQARYRTDLPVGALTLNLQATKDLEQTTQLQPTSAPRDYAGEIGYPDWVGNFDATYQLDKWSFFYSLRYVDATSNRDHFGNQAQTYNGVPVVYVLTTPPQFYSNISVSRELPWGSTVRIGVSNVFDKEPPQVTSLSGEYSTLGNVPLDGAQYDLFGRTFFINVTKKF